MIEYSHQNSLTFGYNGFDFNSRPSNDAKLTYEMARCERDPKDFKEECYITAKMMARKARNLGRKPFVMLSGGMDSEVLAKSFLDQGIDFTPITFKFRGGLNDHEIHYVDKFCKAHDIKPLYYDIDAIPWIQSTFAKTLWEKSYCSSPVMLCHMRTLTHVWKDLNGMPILGGGDVVIEKHEDNTWHYSKYEYILAWYWHMRSNQIDGGVAFFQHTPEITLAMLNRPGFRGGPLG